MQKVREQRWAESRRRRLRWVVRSTLALTLTAAVMTAFAGPAYAAVTASTVEPAPAARTAATSPTPTPSGPAGPAGGALPAAAGPLTFPAPPAPVVPPPIEVVGPLGVQIITESSATERLGEQFKAIDDELASARAITAELRLAWEQAVAQVAAVEARAAEIATGVYKDATALGPFDEFANGLQQFGRINPALPPQLDPAGDLPERDVVLQELLDAQQAERDAKATLDRGLEVEAEIMSRRAVVQEQFNRHRSALNTLVTRNAGLLAAAQAARDAYEDSLTVGRGPGGGVSGMLPASAALSAIGFALSQLGKPYEWAAEGPNSYDCSGLMLAAYLSVGIRLPRVSRFQYGYGTPVLVSQLLPGDLLFFSTDRSDWRQIHHVALYIGAGKMVHAPTFGDVVKISPIWWTEYFGATRVIPAVPGPATSPSPSPSPSASPTPSVSPSPTASPSSSPSPSPTVTSSPAGSPTGSPTSSPSASPSPAASPSASSPSSPSPAPEDSSPPPTETPTTDPSASADPSATTDPAPEPSVSSTPSAPATPEPSSEATVIVALPLAVLGSRLTLARRPRLKI